MGHERRAARPAQAPDRVETPFGMEPLHDLRRAARHRLHRGTSITGACQLADIGARSRCDLLAGHIG